MINEDNNIIILSKFSKEEDFPKGAYRLLFEAETKHFWFWGRNIIINSIIKKTLEKTNNKTFLEIGCGSGIVLTSLEKLGLNLKGLDMHIEGLKFARKRTSAILYCADSRKASFKDKFDAIGLFDVIEHIDDDKVFLKDCQRFLKKGGYLYLTVPAHMFLWSKSDEASGHKRRYEIRSLRKIIEEAGYKVSLTKYFNFSFFLPQLFLRKINDRKTKSNDKLTALAEGLKVPPSYINMVMKGITWFESFLFEYINFPFGTSIIVAAKLS